MSFLVFSCTDTLTNIGSGIQPASDQITIGTDTFHLKTETVFVDSIFSRPDSFLLGTFYDTKFGTVQADILAQVNCPVGFKFPPNAIPDSASVVLYYRTWFGSQYSPLDVNVYELNKTIFDYSSLYPSNLNPDFYTDRSVKLGERIFTAHDVVVLSNDSTYQGWRRKIKLSDDFVNQFFKDSYYTSTSKFLNFFKGIYVTANYGAASLLTINQLDLNYYYHYTYVTKNISGGDSIVTVKNNVVFPANSEVRQVNRFTHNDRRSVVQIRDSVNYISSPANLQTRVYIPLSRIKKHMDAGINGKKLTVNSALLRVDVTETEQDTASQHTPVRYLLLIKESAKDRFFINRELPSDTCAIRGDYTAEEIGLTGVYRYYYSFKISKLIANEILIHGSSVPENMAMRLVPVKIATSTSSSGTVSYESVKEDYLMSAVTIRSGNVIEAKDAKDNKPTLPMCIKLVYSGF